MKNVALCLLTMALMLSSGCSILFPDNRPHVKEVADKLDAIPIGTPLNEISWLNQNNFGHLQPWNLALGYLFYNPAQNREITLYRQVPDGILLQVTTDDYQLTPPVIEDGSLYIEGPTFGTLAVFFDSDKKYKGYFASSLSGVSKDSKERLELGKKQFVDSGTIQWSEYIQKVFNYSSSYFQDHWPKTPLFQNTNQLSAPLPDHEMVFYSWRTLHFSDEEDQILYSKVMKLFASSTFNSEPFNWRSTSKYADEYNAMNSRGGTCIRISFLPQGTTKVINTLAGEIDVAWVDVSLNYENSNIIIFTPTKYNIIAHDKFDPKLCDELWKAVNDVSAGKH